MRTSNVQRPKANVQRLLVLALLLCGLMPCRASMRKQPPPAPPMTLYFVMPPEPSAMLLPLSAPRTPGETRWNFAKLL